MTAQDVIDTLGLEPHPEGGWFRQTWESETGGERPDGTAIYYLLAEGESSHWHRVDAAEMWHFYAGAPLALRIAADDAGPARRHLLGADLAAGERPQVLVPPRHWQAAASTGGWTLVGCTVSPAFRFEGFELAPEAFDIPDAG